MRFLACDIKTKTLSGSVVVMSQEYRVMFKESFAVTFSQALYDFLVSLLQKLRCLLIDDVFK